MRCPRLSVAASVLVLVAVPTVASAADPTGRDVSDTCRDAPDGGFSDVAAGNVHKPMIDCVKHLEVTSGKTSTTYDPSGTLRADQLATFVANTLAAADVALPEPTRDHYDDDNGNPHERNINRLAEAGIVNTSTRTYRPGAIPSRAQMSRLVIDAAFYAKAADPTETVPDYFTDDDGHPLEDAVNRVAHAGVVTGKGAGRFAPDDTLRRDQMATFLARAVDLARTGSGGGDVDAPATCGDGKETGQVLIASIRADGPGNDVEVYNDSEYVTLTNPGRSAVELSGWKLTDTAGNDIVIPAGYSIPANGSFRVYSGAGDQQPTARYFASRSQAMWNNGGDSATLCNASGATVDTYAY